MLNQQTDRRNAIGNNDVPAVILDGFDLCVNCRCSAANTDFDEDGPHTSIFFSKLTLEM